VQNVLQEGGGGDNGYNLIVQELKMISEKLNEIQNLESEVRGKKKKKSNEEDGSRYTSTMQINLHLHEH